MNLLVLNYEYPPLGGGAGEITKNISENIADLGHSVTVVTTWYNGLSEDEILNKVRVIRLRSKRKTMFRSNVLEMRSWIRKSKFFLEELCGMEKFDICFANFSIPGGDVALFIKKKFNIPYTVISHGHDIPWMYKKEMFFYHMLTYFRIKNICKNSSFNFIQTNEMKKNIDHFVSEKLAYKNIIIQNGIDPKVFFPDISKRKEKIHVLFSGRLVAQKDPLTFLKAIKILYESQAFHFKVTIAGDGPLKRSLHQFVNENRLSEIVKFSGWIPRNELIPEYQQANIFVQSSRYEAMSMAVMEALSCGAFVICTKVGSNYSVIKEDYNGAFTEAGNIEMAAEKIKQALIRFSSDKNWIAPAGTITVWNRLADTYLDYFNKALSE